MRLTFATMNNAKDVHNWSGTLYHMSHGMEQIGTDVNYIGSLKRKLPPFFKLKQTFNHYVLQQRESPRFNEVVAKNYSAQVAARLRSTATDAILSPLINPIAYLDCKQPIYLWTDALYAGLLGFYAPFSKHSSESVRQGNLITAECLKRCRLAIFSSDWAANSAIELYGTERSKVKVVPFGANLDVAPPKADILHAIQQRDTQTIKLLFLAKDWHRKGGDIVLAVTKTLHAAGHPVELNIVGYHPPVANLPSYMKCHGFVSKHTPEGKQKIRRLLAESHFLFVPSRAEAYGIVFCEANAFGVPCLTTHVGGISTIIKDDINGKTFSLESPVATYCDYILDLMRDRKRYIDMAHASYNEFETRLNWKVAAGKVKELIAATM